MPQRREMVERIGQYAVSALLYEVAATPKPGLVDRLNSGAHRDMDFFSFMASSAALGPFFLDCARQGAQFEGEDPAALFSLLRSPGRAAEQSMLRATGGVNTHKGLIFSLGIISAAAAYSQRGDPACQSQQIERICETVSRMTRGICARELGQTTSGQNATYGERLYGEYGMKGVRGEAESGFGTVRAHALPVLNGLLSCGKYSLNDALVQTLLHLIAVNDDTNIAARGGPGALCYAKEYASRVLAEGGALTQSGMEAVRQMDRDFIERNISPGGSADLLAVTVMFHLLGSSATV